MLPNMRRMRASPLSSSAVDTNYLARFGSPVGPRLIPCSTRPTRINNRTPTGGHNMLSAAGCQARLAPLCPQLDPPPASDLLRLADLVHLMYLANFWVDPFSLGAGFGGVLLLRRDGQAKLLHDDRLPRSVEAAHVRERTV